MKLDRRGLIATIVYHTLLILLLVFAGLTFPDPPPEEAGILVNFGTDDTGFGAFEPKGDDQQAGEPDQPVVDQTEAIVEEVYTPPVQTQVDQTQDVEEVKVKEVPKPTPEEIQRQKEEKERIQREKIERDRIEKERLEKERIEREKQEQAEKLNNLGKNAFGKQGVGETGGSQGVTEGTGNQGDINGSPDADRYGTGGGLGEGISFGGLGSRKAMGNLPKPNMSGCEITQKIEVKVEIQVDKEGNVISAIVQSATYQDNCIWTMVVEAAKKSRFSVDPNANYRQTGWIRYIIVP
jgi:outer membrane biosynthesis protein TonB